MCSPRNGSPLGVEVTIWELRRVDTELQLAHWTPGTGYTSWVSRSSSESRHSPQGTVINSVFHLEASRGHCLLGALFWNHQWNVFSDFFNLSIWEQTRPPWISCALDYGKDRASCAPGSSPLGSRKLCSGVPPVSPSPWWFQQRTKPILPWAQGSEFRFC